MKERILTSLFMLCLFTAQVHAQATVESMTETNDFIPGNDQRKDYNNQLCALVKVQVVDDITDVEGSVMGDIILHGVEKWVYMAQNSRNMKIHLRNNLPVKVMFKDYGIQGLKSNRIYELVIKIPNTSQQQQTHATGQGKLQMNVTPKDANVEIWGDNTQRQTHRATNDGMISIQLPYGRYYYKVTANGYTDIEGNVFVSDAPAVQTITLQHTQEWINEQQRLVRQRIERQKKQREQQRAEQQRLAEQRLAEQRRLEEEKRQELVRKKNLADSIAKVRADSIAKVRELRRQEAVRIKAEKEAERARIKKIRHDSMLIKLEKLDKKSFVVGIKAGYNMAKAQFGKKYDGTTGSIGGFHVGLTADLRLSDTFHLISGLFYSNKGYTYTNNSHDIDEEGKGQFFDIPLQASIRLPLGRTVRMSINAGPYTSICAGGKVKDNWSNSEENFSSAYSSFNYGLQAGLGFIFYQHFQIGADYQFGMGSKYQDHNLMVGIGYRF